MEKIKREQEKYRVYFDDELFCETLAVSIPQAINNSKCQLGIAGTYQYHDYEVTKIKIYDYELKKFVEVVDCNNIIFEENTKTLIDKLQYKNEYLKYINEDLKNEIKFLREEILYTLNNLIKDRKEK